MVLLIAQCFLGGGGGERKVTYTLLISCLYVFLFSHTRPATRGVMGVGRLFGGRFLTAFFSRSFLAFSFLGVSAGEKVGEVLIKCGRRPCDSLHPSKQKSLRMGE